MQLTYDAREQRGSQENGGYVINAPLHAAEALLHTDDGHNHSGQNAQQHRHVAAGNGDVLAGVQHQIGDVYAVDQTLCGVLGDTVGIHHGVGHADDGHDSPQHGAEAQAYEHVAVSGQQAHVLQNAVAHAYGVEIGRAGNETAHQSDDQHGTGHDAVISQCQDHSHHQGCEGDQGLDPAQEAADDGKQHHQGDQQERAGARAEFMDHLGDAGVNGAGALVDLQRTADHQHQDHQIGGILDAHGHGPEQVEYIVKVKGVLGQSGINAVYQGTGGNDEREQPRHNNYRENQDKGV